MYIYFLLLFIIIIPLFLVLCQWHVCGELVKKMYKFSKIVLPSIELAVSWSCCEHLTSYFSSGNSRWMPFHCIIFKAMFTIYFRLRGLHSPILLFTPASTPILVHATHKSVAQSLPDMWSSIFEISCAVTEMAPKSPLLYLCEQTGMIFVLAQRLSGVVWIQP